MIHNPKKTRQVHIYISGFVQGVGFRNFIQHKAKKMGIYGWTRNLSDNRVEVVAQGDEELLKKFIIICERGPILSEVKNIAIDWEEVQEIHSAFTRLPTF